MSTATDTVEIVSIVRDERVRAARSLPSRPSPNRRWRPPVRRRRQRTPWFVKALVVFAIAVAALIVTRLLVPSDSTPLAEPTPMPSITAPGALPTPPSDTIASGSVADPAAAIAALDALALADGNSAPDYDRDLFGQRWADVDRNGCDTRNDMLARDLADPSFKPGTRDCKVLTGTLTDPYSGASIEFVNGPDTSPRVQIDHIVALAWAWRQGAHEWSPEQRETFANDPRNLRASGEATNQAKSDSGPSRWLPPAPELQCRFVMEWASVVVDYDLSINADDRDAAQHVLRSCPAA
ncbi:HNH endonuclease family protein [Microbacterium sp. YY-03]|uniref:HNH endonuclease family protein n=1 Tax=Microbacterium sp. YY-03 TaxID=3421636 RepID=UPI003D181059